MAGECTVHPNPLVVRAYLVRGALLWIVARAAITVALVLAGSDALRLSTTALAEVSREGVGALFWLGSDDAS